jgi:hypothetical protein
MPMREMVVPHTLKAIRIGAEMSEVTCLALPFVSADNGIAAGEPTECFNPNAAVMRADELSRKAGHLRRSR